MKEVKGAQAVLLVDSYAPYCAIEALTGYEERATLVLAPTLFQSMGSWHHEVILKKIRKRLDDTKRDFYYP